jgi:hypothetical protein
MNTVSSTMNVNIPEKIVSFTECANVPPLLQRIPAIPCIITEIVSFTMCSYVQLAMLHVTMNIVSSTMYANIPLNIVSSSVSPASFQWLGLCVR